MKKILALTASIILFAVAISQASSLTLGGNYSGIYSVVNGNKTVEGGGSIDTVALDGRLLDYLYCVDLFTNVYVNANYPFTTFNNAGLIHENTVHSVGEVAWLLENYGIGGQGYQAQALQAAIWEVINGYNVYHLDSSHSPTQVVTLYDQMLTGIESKSGDVSKFLWIDPGNDVNGNNRFQGLVTSAPVPEPATLLLFGAGLTGLVGLSKKRKRTK